MLEKSINQTLKYELSLAGIICFLLNGWKMIAAFGLLGLIGGLIFMAMATNQYEASVQIQLAQVAPNEFKTNPIAVNIEEPSSLISRFNFSAIDVRECHDEKDFSSSKNLLGRLKLSSVKGVNSIVELNVRVSSRELAIKCSEALFRKIQELQYAIVEPQLLEVKNLLTNYQNRLKEVQLIVSRFDNSGNSFPIGYFLIQDEGRFLIQESARLSRIIRSIDVGRARLVSPIHVKEVSISKKKNLILIVGLLIGISSGIFSLIIRNFFLTYKN